MVKDTLYFLYRLASTTQKHVTSQCVVIKATGFLDSIEKEKIFYLEKKAPFLLPDS